MPLIAFVAILVLLPILMIVFSLILTPPKPNPVKTSQYECGEIPVGSGRPQFVIQYYAYAIVFTVFDVIGLFLLIGAADFVGLGSGVLIPLLLIIGVVTLSLIHAWQLLGRRTAK
mgnify:FL=1